MAEDDIESERRLFFNVGKAFKLCLHHWREYRDLKQSGKRFPYTAWNFQTHSTEFTTAGRNRLAITNMNRAWLSLKLISTSQSTT
jgi:hypothetical protein